MTEFRHVLTGLPPLRSVGDLADAMHLSRGLLTKLLMYGDAFYREVHVAKRGGGYRILACPSLPLRAVQRWVLRNILDRLAVADCATGFVRSKGIARNVEQHLGNRYLLCMDIADFFGSVPYAHVQQVFRSIGYARGVAGALAQLCTRRGALPQGAPTSPALSNLVSIRMDRRLTGLCGRHNVTYTRYADDFAFSARSPGRLARVAPTIRAIVADEGFELNEGKTRFAGPRRQRRVTGLILRDDGYGISREQKRLLRAMVHRFHVSDDMEPEERAELGGKIEGWLAFLKDVDPEREKQLLKYREKLPAPAAQ